MNMHNDDLLPSNGDVSEIYDPDNEMNPTRPTLLSRPINVEFSDEVNYPGTDD